MAHAGNQIAMSAENLNQHIVRTEGITEGLAPNFQGMGGTANTTGVMDWSSAARTLDVGKVEAESEVATLSARHYGNLDGITGQLISSLPTTTTA